MGRLKVLFISDCLGNGGKERQLVEILKYINKDKFSCGVITFNKDDYYSKTIRNLVDYFNEFDKSNIILPIFSIWRSFEDYKPDIIHTLDSLSSFYSLLPARYYKTYFINGSIQDAGIEKGFLRSKKIFLLKCSDLVIANSYAGLKSYGIKGEVLYNIINLNRFHQPEKRKSFNVIMVANFSDYKDYDYYLRICGKLIDFNLIDNAFIAGTGKYSKKYEKYVNDNYYYFKGKVKFLGNIDKIEDILVDMSVGFLCSKIEYGEGISNSVLEYMAAGVIPIVTNIGASGEIINNGSNGFLIEQNQEQQVLDIVSALKSDTNLFDNIVKEARITIENKFEVRKNIEKLESIYRMSVN